MKKKLIAAAAIFCTLVVVILIIARITGMLLFYKVPTPSSEPTLKIGNWVFTTNLKEPIPYKFIVFTSTYIDSINSDYSPAGSIYLQRLCGVPGNIIGMKNGVFYVNNKNFDKTINLNNQYMISSAESDLIDPDDMTLMEKSGGFYTISKDSTLVVFDNVLMKKYSAKIKPAPYILAPAENGPFKWNNKDETWTPDNFGPLKIPTDCYFVLGDNRHNAMDSRYIGFVKKEDIKGVVLNK